MQWYERVDHNDERKYGADWDQYMPHDSGIHQVPLCIDLDGTFFRTDSLYESLIAKLKVQPWLCLFLPFWLLRGRAYLKAQLSDVELNMSLMPRIASFHQFVEEQYRAGRTLILATGADQRVADRVACAFPFFAGVIASDGARNNTGAQKLAALRAQHARFDYAGNSRDDLVIWRAARKCYLVNPSRGVKRAARRESFMFEKVFQEDRKAFLRLVLKALRPHQWAKNVLLFVPLITAHVVTNIHAWLEVGLAVMAFSALASSVYLINDIVDLENDRQHPTKRNRPFAAAALSLKHAFWMVPGLWLVTLLATWRLPLSFQVTLLLYFVLTTAYSFFLKQQTLVDVILLASLYTIRVQAGAEAIQVEVSPWLRAFSLFFFVSLAFTKRFSELQRLAERNTEKAAGRGYQVADTHLLGQMGITCGFLSVLVMALYVNSPEVHLLYRYPQLLWAICLVVLYWISRVWLLTQRGEMHEDPVVFAIRDKTSYALGLITAAILWWAV